MSDRYAPPKTTPVRCGSVADLLRTDRGMATLLNKFVGVDRWVYDPVADRWLYPASNTYARTAGRAAA